jgi:O-antigen/teichoic acid export membrane protein
VRQPGRRTDLAILLALLFLALLFFWPVTLGRKTMLPADNVFVWEPWQSQAATLGLGTPHNGLVSDLYLQNYAWKRLIVQALRDRQIPLWNPYILAGAPFLAAGQHSALYPLGVLFYVLPLPAAYGWFAALHLFLAGAFTYLLGRTLGLRRMAAALAAVTFELCGYLVIGNVFPMIVAAAVWLPLILLAIERVAQRAEADGIAAVRQIPDLLLGACGLGMVMLAGHPEMYYYVGLAAALYSLWRLARLGWQGRRWSRAMGVAGLLLAMAMLGIGLGAAQWLPLLDLVRHNFRQGGASFQEVLGWAYPRRRLIALLLPDFFGNPAHHRYLDLFTWRMTPVSVNTQGQAIRSIEWGIKNYVEGAAYVGALPLALAAIGVTRRKLRDTGLFVGLGLLSLLFAFGSPLYYLVYKLPGFSQVHTPFRWVYPYSLCVALLAGMGVDALCGISNASERWARMRCWLAERLLPWATLLGGAALLGGLGASLLMRDRAAALAERLMSRLALAPTAFSDGRMFYSYQARNVAILGAALLAGGLFLVLRHRLRPALWGGLLCLVVAGELVVIGRPFFPAVDPSLVGYRTPAIDFLAADSEPYRITAYIGGDEKTFNANAGMFYDIADVRGYDSIIPRQYAEYMALLHPQGELIYNRIAPIYEGHAEALDSHLLDMLNVKYVLADRDRPIARPGYVLAYDGEILIYRNEDYLPRAYTVSRAVGIPDATARRDALLALDPRREVILEEPLDRAWAEAEPRFREAEIASYGLNEVRVAVATASPAWLVLGDSYFDGWLAFIREAGAPEDAEHSLTIYRANGNFRAVQLPAGRYEVRFKYSPNSVKYGLYFSFLAAMMLALAAGYWAWRRYYREPTGDLTVERVTKNTVAPIALNLVNKVIDMAFAMLMLRILGPADAGQYYLAVVVISWFDILINFGLNTLVTREVAREKSLANRYLTNSIVARFGIWGLSLPLLALFVLFRAFTKPLEAATLWAIGLFLVGLLPSNISASLSAIFNAYERMETPASVTTLTTLLKVCLGAAALFLGTGYVGLAMVSIVVNLITLGVLYVLLRRLVTPQWRPDWPLQRRMLRDAWPLMINLLLASLFFKVAVFLLEWLLPDPRVLGWYSTAYKYIDAVGVIPAYFTLAIFPLMARYAATDREALLKAYRLAIKLLVAMAVSMGFVFSLAAREWIGLLGGAQYLPQAADVLRVMIWYMPFGFINSVTQYVLIALDQQRFLTRAFAIGLAFNLLANVVLISRWGYIAAAYVAIASELALLIPFYIGIRKHLAPIPWVRLTWKVWASAAPMALLAWLLPRPLLPLALLLGLICFVGGLYLLRAFDSTERQALRRALRVDALTQRLPERWRGAVDAAPPPR